MDEQLLKDFIATAQKDNYDWNKIFGKFPELKGYDQQLLKDYVATAEEDNYNYEVINAKFPELGFQPSAPQQEEEGFFSGMMNKAKSLFGGGEEDVKKKEQAASMALPSAESSLASPSGGNFESILNSINETSLGEDEDDIEDNIGKKLKPLGVTVSQDKAFREAIKLSVGEEGKPGYKEISVPVDNFFSKNDKKSSVDLKKWLADNTDKNKINEQEAVASEFQRATVNEQAFNKALGGINADLISKDEESIVPQLTAMFGNYGIGDKKFQFEEVGATDNIKVTAPNGKVFVTEVDSFTTKGDEKIAADLKKFMDENKPVLLKAEDNLNKYATAFLSEKEMEDANKSFSIEADNFKNEVNSALLEKKALEKGKGKMSNEEYNQRSQALNDKITGISNKEGQLNSNKLMLDKSLAKYVEWRSEQGGIVGSIWNSVIGGYGSQASGITGLFGDLALSIAPPEVTIADYRGKFLEQALQNGVDVPSLKMSESEFDKWTETLPENIKDGIESKVLDIEKKKFKEEVAYPSGKALVKTLGVEEVTPEYMEKAQKTTVLQSGAMGVAGSLPAMAGAIAGPGGGKLIVAQFALQGYDATMKEMSGKGFEDVAENEKYLVAVPVAILNGVLEEYGLRNLIGKSGVTTSILSSVMGKAGKKATASTFKELVENEVESGLSRGLLTLGAAGLAEGETGATQQLGELTIKEIYNQAKDKELFQTPNGVSGWLDEIGESAKQEAVGGMIMGSIGAVSTAASANNYNGISDKTLMNLELLRDDETIRSAFVANLKYDIASGKKTKEQAETELNGYNKSISIYNQIPSDITNAAKRKAFGLLAEKTDLESKIQGKDESLTKKDKERIAEIKNELSKLPEMTEEGAASYLVNGEQMSEEDFAEAIINMTADEMKSADIKATNASDRVTNLLKSAANMNNVESAPMMETTTPQEKIALSSNKKMGDLSNELQDEIDNSGLVSQGPIGDMAENKSVGEAIDNKIEYHQLVLERENAKSNPDQETVNSNTNALNILNDLKAKVEQENIAVSPAEAAAAEAAAPAKPKTLDKIEEGEVRNYLLSELEFYENPLKGRKKRLDEFVGKKPFILKPFAKLSREIVERLPISENKKYEKLKEKVEQIKNNPEQYINDEIETYEKDKEDKGEDFEYQPHLDKLYDLQSKLQEQNAVQKPTTEEGVLRTEQSQVGLPTMGQGNAQETTTQEGVAPAKPQEVKPTEAKSEVDELLDLDVKNEDNLLKVYDFLDKIDNDLKTFGDENLGMNVSVVAARGIVKTIKALVKGGMLLRDAIKKVAKDNKISEKDVNDILDTEKIRVNVAPFFDKKIANSKEAASLRKNKGYKQYINTLNKLASDLGLKINIQENIGGYKNESGDDIVEISNTIFFENATIEQAEEYAALSAALAPEVQEASIAGKYVDENSPESNATEITISVGDIDAAIEALKKSNILNYSINEKEKTVSIIDVKDFADVELQKKIGNFTNELSNNNIKYGKEKYRAIESRYVDAGKRKEILRRIKKEGNVKGQAKPNFRNTFVRAVKRDAQFQKTTVAEYEGKQPAAGNRLFSKPVKGVATIADRYYKRVFGEERPKYLGSKELNKERAKKISDAFIAMKYDPFNPEVRAAYEALAKETIDQYNAFLDAGYVVEVNNEEPYANSEEMINDLRDNKRIKIFSTESGFGDTPITEKQRSESPLLAKTDFVDKNGNPLLVNDLFRAIHDFFGHAELGNAFGPKGEENAWNVHARMFSDLARKAMTTETRGQNSYVNFSGVNEKVKALREKARELRENGDEEGAQKIVSEIYEIASFADQKIGLLPKEFYEIDKADIGDVKKQQNVLENLLDLDTKDKTNLQKVFDFLDKTDKDLTKFSKQTLGVNIAIPVMKAIVKSLKVLVKGGMTLQEAITKVAKDNKVSFDDVVAGMKELAETVSAETVEGYERMMAQVDNIIEKGLNRNTNQQDILNNVISYIQGSKAYENATAQQQEEIIRDVKKAFGEKMKSAPSAKKILGFLKDVKKVTVDEMMLLKKQFKDMAKGAKTAESAINKASRNLTESLKDLVKKGDITTKQMLTVLRKFSKTNLLDDESVDKFVNYMTKVFADAEYADKISKAYTQLKVAKNNIKTKIGIADDLHPLLRKIFSVNPNLIPDAVFEKYLGLVDMFGQKKQVLKLDNKQDVVNLSNEIIDAMDEELSLSEELSDRFSNYADKVVDANGKVDYAATIQAMVKDNTITEDEAKIMRKYKSKIFPSAKPTPKTDAELAQEKQDLLTALNGVDIDTENLPTHDEREVARKLDRLIRSDAVNEMSNEQLTNLLKVIDNINNGYLPHYSQLMLERLNALNNGVDLKNAIDKAKPLSLTKLYANLKSIFTRKESITEMVRRSPLYYIDQVFGNFKSKDIFNSLFKSASEAETLFKSKITAIQNKLDNAQEAVAKSFKNNPNKVMMSKFKMMTYMIQLEHQSNPNSKQVNPASEYLKATIKHIDEGKSSFGERDANMLQKVLDNYNDANGNIDIDKLYNSFNAAEKKAIATIKELNESLREKAMHTSAIIRGDKINLLENYVHLNVLHDAQPDDAISGVTSAEAYNNSLRPSTKAKSLIARTGKVAPLNFDVFASAHRGAKFVLMDYYLTEPIRTARKTINEATAMIEKDGRIPKEKRQILNAISNAFEETTENILNNVFVANSFADEVVNYMSKSGYRAVLASAPRFIAELTSNISFALFTDPKALSIGYKYRNIVMSSDAVKILNNVKSKQTNRIFPHETLAGRLIDTSIMSQASGIKGGRAKSDVANVIQTIYNNSLKKYKNIVETSADALISTPDKMIMRPMWFGSFANEFKKLTGKNIDFDKIANNDEAYILDNKDAIDDARDMADQTTIFTGATDNPYMDTLKGKIKPNQSALARGFNVFNNYMTKFTIYEYTTARTGVMAAMGNGSLTRKQGVALMAGVTTRMVLYTLLAQTLGSGMVGLFVDDDDDDDEKSLGKKFGQALTSTFTSLFLGRDFGNATKTIVNYGLERVNENYLDALREGDYDPYKDAIQYSIIPPDVKGKKTTLTDYITNMAGPFAPTLKTADLIVRKLSEESKKTEESIERSENEMNVRIPLEILGNVGLIPLYKDIRKITMKNIYKDLDKAEKAAGEKEEDIKPYGLNKEELKKYMPDVYEKYYGEETNYAKDRNAKSKIRKKKDNLRKKMLDDRYNYISPKEKGFGSSNFGKGSEKKKKTKKDIFGSAKFGSK